MNSPADDFSPNSEPGYETLYVLTNESLPGLVKVGRTFRSAEERARELSGATGVPTVFKVYRAFAVTDAVAAELTSHRRLSEYRVAENREFFRIDPDDACMILESILHVSAREPLDDEKSDELLAKATEIALDRGEVWPGLLVGELKVDYSTAKELVSFLLGRGVVDTQLKLSGPYREQLRVLQEAQRALEAEVARREAEKAREEKKLIRKNRLKSRRANEERIRAAHTSEVSFHALAGWAGHVSVRVDGEDILDVPIHGTASDFRRSILFKGLKIRLDCTHHERAFVFVSTLRAKVLIEGVSCATKFLTGIRMGPLLSTAATAEFVTILLAWKTGGKAWIEGLPEQVLSYVILGLVAINLGGVLAGLFMIRRSRVWRGTHTKKLGVL